MRKYLIGAGVIALLTGVSAGQAAAQPGYYGDRPPPRYDRGPPPRRDFGPPPGWRHRQAYSWCQQKARRLYDFEYRMQLDGRVSRDERRIAASLEADLAASCGGGRWHPNRGWYYR